MGGVGLCQRHDHELPLWRESAEVAESCAQMLLEHRLGRLLDAGGGEGFVTAYLMRNRVVDEAVVFDRDETLLAEVPPPIQTKRGRLEHLDSSDGEFSTILIRQVLHYLDMPVATLRRVGGRLRPGGAIYVGQMVAPNPRAARWLGAAAGWVSPTRRRVWTVNQLLTTFATAGLVLEKAAVVPQRLPLADRVRTSCVPACAPHDEIHSVLRVEDRRGTVTCRVYWLHALLRNGGG